MRFIMLFLVFLLSFSWNLSGGNTVIRGTAPEYAGVILDFMIYSNQISYSEKKIATAKIDARGQFTVSFDINSPQLIFVRTGVYFLYLYAEPGSGYTVQLPPRQEKKPEEKLNPYFEEKMIHLIISESVKSGQVVPAQQDLNFFIRSFDDYYGPYMAKYAYNVATQGEIADRDTTISKIQSLFPDNQHPFYNNYKNYKIGFLKLLSFKNKSRSISNDYFLDKPILYNNPAYTELFNQVYDQYFSYFGRTAKGKAIFDDINLNKSYTGLKKTLAQDNVLNNDSLREFVILKCLYDEFYGSNFSRQALLTILDSLINQSAIPVHRETGKEIRNKITRLLAGFRPPDFKLYDQEGKLRSPEDFKGKYTYLMFCTTRNYACITEFEQVKKLYQKHADKLNIVTILADDDFEASKKFIRGKQLPWTFLHYANSPDVLKDYDIRAFPTYFLIDPEGRLSFSPAPSPLENFELRLFNEMRAKGML